MLKKWWGHVIRTQEPTCRGFIGQIWINLNTRIIKYSNYRPLRKSRNLGISNHNKQIHGKEERVLPYTGMPSAVSCQGGRKIVILQLLQMLNVGYIVELAYLHCFKIPTHGLLISYKVKKKKVDAAQSDHTLTGWSNY